MFDRKKPTVQLLGRWQPWHDGHQELFKRALQKTGQVIIQVRDVQGISAGMGHDDNPFDWDVFSVRRVVSTRPSAPLRPVFSADFQLGDFFECGRRGIVFVLSETVADNSDRDHGDQQTHRNGLHI